MLVFHSSSPDRRETSRDVPVLSRCCGSLSGDATEQLTALHVALRAILPKRGTMKRAFIAASAIAILAGAQAFAQTVGVGPAETVVIEPEQRTTIREYVVKERVAPVTVKERISVGATLPADVELRTVPSTWGPKFSKYRYVYSGDRVYLVEPTNRTVVQVVE